MAGLTLSQIQAQVIQLTKEYTPSNPTFATLANVATYGNEAQSKIMRRTRNRIKTNFPNLPGGKWLGNQYQNISFSFIPVSGSITLTFNGQVTASLPISTLTSSVIQTALTGLTNIGAGNVSVTGTNADGYLIIFYGQFVGQVSIPLIIITPTAVIDVMGNTVTISVTGVVSGNQDAANMTVIGQRLYNLPSDFLQMEKVSVNNVPCKNVRLHDISNTLMWHRLPGWPTHYYFERDQFTQQYKLGLWLNPTQAWPLGLEYIPIPVQMSVSTDYPDLEEFLHPAVVHYVCKRIMEYRREYSKAQYWANEYESDLRDYDSSGQDSDETIGFLYGARPTD